MNIDQIITIIDNNNKNIQRLQTDLNSISSEIPNLTNYSDEDFERYLITNGFTPQMSNFQFYKAQLITKYKKRQDSNNNIAYYETLNEILYNMIDFYKKYLRDPNLGELETLSVGTGIEENIIKAIAYIEETIL